MHRSLTPILAVGLSFLSLATGQDANTFLSLYKIVEDEFAQSDAKTIVRLAFHDAMGGVDGRINTADSEHNGLIGVFNRIDTLFNNNQNLGLGRSDFFAWAYVAAFYMTVNNNPPWVTLTFGRANVDSATEDKPPNGEFGAFDHAAVLSYFSSNFGFSTSDTATILGAHTLGGAERANSGFIGDWTTSPNTFNSRYYDTMDDPPGNSERWEQVQVGTNKFEWRWGCGGNDGCRDLMLNVDMSLLFDITYDSVGKAVLPAGSSCSSNRIFDDCFPAQRTGTQDTVNSFIDNSRGFRSSFAGVYSRMLNRVKTSSTLASIGEPGGWPDILDQNDAGGSGDGDDDDVEDCECFSGSSTVYVQNHGLLEMRDLHVGDKVWTGRSFEPVYAFGHRQEMERGSFLTVHTSKSKQKPLELTTNHMIFKEDNGALKAIPARELMVGDMVQQMPTMEGLAETVAVTKILTVAREGLYMPLTPSGTILVDGILASTYVSIQEEAPKAVDNIIKFVPFLSEDMISHWWLSPYRMMCLGVSSSLCKSPIRNDRGILQWLVLGKSFAEFADEKSFIVRVFALGLPTFLIFGLFNLAEVVLGGPSLAPLMLLAIASALLWIRNGNKKSKSKAA